MNDAISENSLRKPRILVAPLDWGLGHATRCIPIIRELLVNECDVWIAGDGIQHKLLAKEFPDITILDLTGYNIKYSKTKTGLFFRLIGQIPKMLDIISYENRWLKIKNVALEFDAVISDNRYGFFNKKVYNVFITHQLQIKTGLGGFFDSILRKINYAYIRKFQACWVPDEKSENNLAGKLSHPDKLPKRPVHYLGLLSRFHSTGIQEQKNHILVVLSGPEPQRSILENMIVQKISQHNGTASVVRGLLTATNFIPSTNTIKFYNYLPAEELNKEMEQAEYVISRSGYSTVMDIAKLKKKSILIPTPGQPEQEYIGKYLSASGMAVCIDQKKFSLLEAIEKGKNFSYTSFPDYDDAEFKKIIKDFVEKLVTRINPALYTEFLG
jgi:UDP-N-acetylglucosamine transferase subunit ALG13